MLENLETEAFAKDEVLAKIVKREDGYHVIDFDGTEGPVCNKRTSDGYIILTPNKANRKCYNEKNAEKFFAEGGTEIPLCYRATRKVGSIGSKLPNEKLIAYLSPEEQEEYKAIIARAIEARNAAKAQPVSNKEKLLAKIEKLKAKLSELTELD